MDRLRRDLRSAFRAITRKPGATVLAIASLALAIGFSTAAFSVLDAYSLRDLPVDDPGRLVWLSANTREHRPDDLSWTEYLAIASRAHSFSGVLAQCRRGPKVKLPDRDDFPITAGVSDNFFDVAGVNAVAGQVFHAGRGQDNTVVLSHRYWRDALVSDSKAVGRDLPVGTAVLRIVGILPAGLTGANRGIAVDLFVPQQTYFGALGLSRPNDLRRSDYEVLGRLHPGVTLAQARAEVEAILRQLEKDGLSAGPERTAMAEEFTSSGLIAKLQANAVMLGVMLLVILIAAANLANLRLVDNEARRRETGIRLALGAGPGDLARQHLGETILLSFAGTAAGLLLAWWLVRLAPALLYTGNRYAEYHIRLDTRVFAFSAVALLLVALTGAAIPLSDAWRRRILPVLATSRAGSGSRWLSALVIVQMALVTGVSCSAGLLWRSLDKLAAVRPAMDPERRLLLVQGGWDALPRTAETAQKIAGVSGVEQVAWARRAMLSGSLGGAVVVAELPGQPKQDFHYNQVSASYFAVTGARVLSGRPFANADSAGATPVVMANETYVRQFAGGVSPLGQWIRIAQKERQIIGVVEDGPAVSLQQKPEAYFYFPEAQMVTFEMTYFIAARDPGAVAERVRAALRESARDFTIFDMVTMRQHLRGARGDHEMAALLAGILAVLGLFLAAAGLFGVTLFAVARRTAEFGIRVAIGATPSRVATQVLRQAVGRVAVAIPLGWLAAYAGRQSIQKLLFGVGADDPLTFVAASALVVAVGTMAALGPALRAAHVDPVTALRHE